MIVIWTYSPEEQNEEMKNVGDQLQEWTEKMDSTN